jgi:hypothetical protein
MKTPHPFGRALRWGAFGLGLLLAYPLGLAIVAAAQTSLSLSAWTLLGGLLLLELSALGLPLRRDAASATGAGLGVLLLVVSGPARACSRPPPARAIAATDDGGQPRAPTGPAPTPAATTPWLLEERDLVLLAAQMLPGTRWLEPGEARGLREGLAAGYDAVLADPGALQPAAATWRGRQEPGLVDAIAVRSDGASPEIGLIFLHGFGGNFAWPCWAMARAARQHAALTLCPSLGTQGDWWSERGLEVAQRTVDALRARGIRRYVLAGLSNGAHGAAAIASALQPRPAGVVLISGLPHGAVPAGLPVLLVQGSADRRVSTARARRLAGAQGELWTYVELQGDHFVWLRQRAPVEAVIRSWLDKLSL